MKRFIAILLLALALSASAYGADTTIRGGTHSSTLNAGDSFLFQRNSSGPYFYINKSELPAALGLTTNLSALGDVTLGTLADKDLLKYDHASGKWVNGTLDWSEITGKPSLATVATGGAYSDLLGLPDLSLTLTGDVTGTGTGNVTAAIKPDLYLTGQPTAAAPIPFMRSGQLATSDYVNATTLGFRTNTTVRFIQFNSELPGTYNNGASGVGATLTNSGAMVALSFSAIPANNGDLVLLGGQDAVDFSKAYQNGLYVVTAKGSGSGNWVLTRSTLYDTPAKINAGITANPGCCGGYEPLLFGGADYADVPGIFYNNPNYQVMAIGTDPIEFSFTGNLNGFVPRDDVPPGQIIIGNSSGIANSAAVTGDVTIDSDAVTTVNSIGGQPVATVATSGAYSDLSGLPILGTASTHAATDFAASGANTDITSVLLNQTGLVVKGASSNALMIKPNETLTAARTLNIVTGDASRTLTFTGDASISGTNTGDQDLSGLVPKTTTVAGHALSSNISIACGDLSNGGTACTHPATDFEVPLTFSTGLTRSTNTITVNSSQSISTLSNLTTNGFVKTGSGTGALSIDTTSYTPTSTTVAGHALSANVSIACGDLSNGAASCSTDTTNASNISSGTLGAGRLPNPSATTLGGVESIAASSHNFVTSISTSGVPAKAQPACGDLSDAASSCNTDATNASNIGSGTLSINRLSSNETSMGPGVSMDGGGSVPATGSHGWFTMPYNFSVTNWYVVADQSCSAVVDIKIGGVSIVGSGNFPTLSSAANNNAAVSGWTTTALSKGNILNYNLNSVATCTFINLVLQGNKT